MAWTGLALTVDGRNALNEAQLSGTMRIKAVVVGDGTPPANFSTQKGLVNQLYAITEIKVDKTESGCTVTADFPRVEYDYYFREIGIIIDTDQGEKLYVYDNCGDDAQYIVNSTGVESTRKRIRLSLNISDVAEITISNPSIMYVAYDDFETAVESLQQAIEKTDTKQQEAIDAAKELLYEIINDHVADKENPHKVNQEQVGLGKVDNTADTEKPVSGPQQAALDTLYEQLTAYTQTKIAELINGAPTSLDTLKEVADAIAAHKSVMDALDAAIGKKANAAEFDSHVADTTKHITAAERTAWGAKLDTTGDASNVTTTFTQATTRANLTTKEKLSVSLGKIMKWFADLANGAASTLLGSNLTANRALISDSSGKVGVSGVSATELGYLSGVTSKVQTQLNALNTGLAGKAASSHTHTKSQITDFPISLPASDVYSWAKAASKPSYSWSEITGKPSIGFIGNYFGSIMFGVDAPGKAFAFYIGTHYLIHAEAKIQNNSYSGSENYIWGPNLTHLLNNLKLSNSLTYVDGCYEAYNSNGALIREYTDYGTSFEVRTNSLGNKILTPARYYNTSGAIGSLPTYASVAAVGTFFKITIVVA